jgi:hypothetical protein
MQPKCRKNSKLRLIITFVEYFKIDDLMIFFYAKFTNDETKGIPLRRKQDWLTK